MKRRSTRFGRLAGFALSISGYLVALGILAWGFSNGHFSVPSGDILVWDRVGDDLRAGRDVYALQPVLTDSFWYAPPWAVIFAALSWLPVVVSYLGIVVLEVAALRYLAGSWIRVGWFCWWPFVAFELPSGNFNLIIAAAIVLAIRGEPRYAVLMALAKGAPALAIRTRDRRKALLALTVACLVTLPWLWLWPDWADRIVSALVGPTLGPQIRSGYRFDSSPQSRCCSPADHGRRLWPLSSQRPPSISGPSSCSSHRSPSFLAQLHPPMMRRPNARTRRPPSSGERA